MVPQRKSLAQSIACPGDGLIQALGQLACGSTRENQEALKPTALPGSPLYSAYASGSNTAAFAQCFLNGLELAESMHMQPFVDFRRGFGKGRLLYLDDAAKREGKNLWECFFAPVSSWRTGCPGNVVGESSAVFRDLHSGKDYHEICALVENGAKNPAVDAKPFKSIQAYYWGVEAHKRHFNPHKFEEKWYLRNRVEAHRLVTKYVRVKPDLLHKVDQIHKHLGFTSDTKYLGVHVRGTDIEPSFLDGKTNRNIGVEPYIPYMEKWLQTYPKSKIYFATDDARLLKIAEKKFGDSILYLKHIKRSMSKRPVFTVQKDDKKQKSLLALPEQVMLDVLMLSRCWAMLSMESTVSEMAFYMSPDPAMLSKRSIHMQYPIGRNHPPWAQ
jgi:hypothetical protein